MPPKTALPRLCGRFIVAKTVLPRMHGHFIAAETAPQLRAGVRRPAKIVPTRLRKRFTDVKMAAPSRGIGFSVAKMPFHRCGSVLPS